MGTLPPIGTYRLIGKIKCPLELSQARCLEPSAHLLNLERQCSSDNPIQRVSTSKSVQAPIPPGVVPVTGTYIGLSAKSSGPWNCARRAVSNHRPTLSGKTVL